VFSIELKKKKRDMCRPGFLKTNYICTKRSEAADSHEIQSKEDVGEIELVR
jgi:hypothetical protein